MAGQRTVPEGVPEGATDDAPSRPYRKRKGEGHVRREEIVAAARTIFLEEGYEHATIRKIAAKAGVSSTALYLYFPDKDSILVELCDRTFERLNAAMDAIGQSEAEPLRRLRAMMEAYLRFGLAHSDEYRLTFMAKTLGLLPLSHRGPVSRDPEKPCDLPGTKGPEGFARLMRMVEHCMAAGVIRGDDPPLVAELIWMAGHGLVSLLIAHPQFPWSDREALIAGLIDMQLNGIATHR